MEKNCCKCGKLEERMYVDLFAGPNPVQYLCGSCNNSDLLTRIEDLRQDIFVTRRLMEDRTSNYNDLAAALGWTPAFCTATGKSPIVVAQELIRECIEYKEKNSQLLMEIKAQINRVKNLEIEITALLKEKEGSV
jgi:hypothetical protein